MKDLYLIDASGFLYRAYFAIRGLTNTKGESSNALFGFVRSYLKFIQDFAPTHVAAIFDGPRSKQARVEIYKDYKTHRKPTPDDLIPQILYAQEYCRLMNIPMLAVEGVEADDTMGSIAVWAKEQGANVYICTSDKDMAQLVNGEIKLLNLFKDNLIVERNTVKELYGVWPEQIQDYLAIVGDASDNIPGIEGFGPKTAVTLLEKYGTLESIFEHKDEIGGKKKEALETQKEIALMSRELAKINLQVEFPHSHDFFALGKPEKEPLKEFFQIQNFKSLLSLIDNEPTASTEAKPKLPESTRHIVQSEEELHTILSELIKAQDICVDTETTSTDPFRAIPVGIGLAHDASTTYYIPLNGTIPREKALQQLKNFFENPYVTFFGHNIKYDLHVLHNVGIQLGTISCDTILASYLLNAHQRRHSLDDLALQYFDKKKIPIEDLIGKGKSQITMAEVPIDKIAEYCCEDVEYTIRLKEVLERQLQERNLVSLFKNIEIPLIRILAKMERYGIFVDRHVLAELALKLNSDIAKLEEEIFAMAGESFNLNSPKQLSEILFQKLGIRSQKKGKNMPSTSADVLESLQNEYPIAQKILEYRSLEKLRSTYVESLPEQINAETGRVHTQFNQSLTATGRLSCHDPNLQNIPVRSEIGRMIRSAFRPEREDWSFLSFDYSQVELRILAHVTQDPGLIDAFHNNVDIHSYTASEIFHVPVDQVTKDMRRHAKAVNFGVIYGQQPFGLSQELGISVQEAARFINAYFKRYATIKDYIEYLKETARKAGKATTLTGRERLLPDINSTNQIAKAQAERLAVNTPFQGTAADIIKLAMIDIDQWMYSIRCQARMLLQIHDELLFEMPDSEIPLLQDGIKARMEGVFELKVPLIVEIGIGKNWMEC